MATIVTIRGTMTPSVKLKTGETRTVQLSPSVEREVAKGFVEIIDRYEVEDPEPGTEEPERPKAPHKGASRDEWVAFVGALDPGFDIPEDAKRDQIVEAYTRYEQQRASTG